MWSQADLENDKKCSKNNLCINRPYFPIEHTACTKIIVICHKIQVIVLIGKMLLVIINKNAPAAQCRHQRLFEWVVEDCHLNIIFVGVGDHNASIFSAVDKVVRSIERINNPDALRPS